MRFTRTALFFVVRFAARKSRENAQPRPTTAGNSSRTKTRLLIGVFFKKALFSNLLSSSILPQFSVAAVNTDWSNRKSIVDTPRKLVNEMCGLTSGLLAMPSLLTVTEWSSASSATSFVNELPEDYCENHFKPGYDYLQTVWNPQMLDLEACVTSNVGKYMCSIFKDAHSRAKLAHFSFHGPYTSSTRKKVAAQALLKELDRQAEDVDHIVIAGVFLVVIFSLYVFSFFLFFSFLFFSSFLGMKHWKMVETQHRMRGPLPGESTAV